MPNRLGNNQAEDAESFLNKTEKELDSLREFFHVDRAAIIRRIHLCEGQDARIVFLLARENVLPPATNSNAYLPFNF